MSINPKDIPGVNVFIVGYAGGEPETKTFDGGGAVTELSVGVGTGYKNKKTDEWVETGTNWYKLTASPEWAEENWPVVEKGDKVRLDDGRLETKAYKTKDGEPKSDNIVRFGTLVVLESASDRDSSGRGSKKSTDTPF